MLKEKAKKVYNSDIRSITKEVPREWLIDGFFEKNGLDKIEITYLYDRNVVTHLASFQGSYWLEPIVVIPTPDDEEQWDAVEEIYPPFDGGYYNTSDVPDKKSEKITVNECNFSWQDDDEYEEKWSECLEYCKENQNSCM